MRKWCSCEGSNDDLRIDAESRVSGRKIMLAGVDLWLQSSLVGGLGMMIRAKAARIDMHRVSEMVRKTCRLAAGGFQQQFVAAASLESSSGFWFPGG